MFPTRKQQIQEESLWFTKKTTAKKRGPLQIYSLYEYTGELRLVTLLLSSAIYQELTQLRTRPEEKLGI
jgi:hypothetical protein